MSFEQAMQPVPIASAGGYLLTPLNVFVLLFIMLGPLKLIAPFQFATAQLEPTALRSLAFKVAAISSTTLLIAGLAGSLIMQQWKISIPVMELTGGLVFLLVALKQVLAQYSSAATAAPTNDDSRVMHLVFPGVVTPYGIAALIALMALSDSIERTLLILGMLMAVMMCNLLAMCFVRPILRRTGPMPLQILAAVLAVQQVALALQVIVVALKKIHGSA